MLDRPAEPGYHEGAVRQIRRGGDEGLSRRPALVIAEAHPAIDASHIIMKDNRENPMEDAMTAQTPNDPHDASQPMLRFCWRTMATHAVAYTIAGLAALVLMNYRQYFAGDFMATIMRPVESPVIPWGASLQLVNGLFIGLILFPFRKVFLAPSRSAWWKLFLLVFGLSLFSPQVPGVGNFEGVVYTRIPLSLHLLGIPECLAYSLLFSYGLPAWYKHDKKWMQTAAVALVAAILLMSVLGYLAAKGLLPI